MIAVCVRIARATALFVFAGCQLCTSAEADLYTFDRVTSNNGTDVAGQFSVDVTLDGGQVLFKFMNAGPVDSIITEIYWDDTNGQLSNFSFDAANSSIGVDMSDLTPTPGNLPGGNTVASPFSADFGADASNSDGVMSLEMAAFKFDGTLNDVLDDLNSGALRIGLHVRAINPGGVGDGTSDSFVNLNAVSTPEASSLSMMALLMGMTLLYCSKQLPLSGFLKTTNVEHVIQHSS